MLKKILILCLFALLTIVFLFQLSRSRTYQVFGNIVSYVSTDKKVVALTFDDGPVKGASETILALLQQEGVKATFFLTGREIEVNPADARTIVAAGHQIGNHSYSHQRMVLMGSQTIIHEVEKTNQLIRSLGYQGEIVFRPPYGKKLFGLPYYLQQQRIKTITWNVEPETDEAIANDSHAIAEHVLHNVKPGSIILLHVMYKSRHASMESVPEIIKGLKEKGYTFVTVNELLGLSDVPDASK